MSNAKCFKKTFTYLFIIQLNPCKKRDIREAEVETSNKIISDVRIVNG